MSAKKEKSKKPTKNSPKKSDRLVFVRFPSTPSRQPQEIEFTDEGETRRFAIPANEPGFSGNPIPHVLSIERTTGVRLKDGADPCWLIRLHGEYLKVALAANGIEGSFDAKAADQLLAGLRDNRFDTFAEWVRKRAMAEPDTYSQVELSPAETQPKESGEAEGQSAKTLHGKSEKTIFLRVKGVEHTMQLSISRNEFLAQDVYQQIISLLEKIPNLTANQIRHRIKHYSGGEGRYLNRPVPEQDLPECDWYSAATINRYLGELKKKEFIKNHSNDEPQLPGLTQGYYLA